MSNKVQLSVTAGPMKGEMFSFDEHDTFLFGREKECHCRLPRDGQVSRRHFIVEVNPPDARIRDFGSLNGTYVNGRKIGRREKGESPEQGQKRSYPDVELRQGDTIAVGQSMMSVAIEADQADGPILCGRCGKDAADEIGNRKQGDYICLTCRESLQVDPAQVLMDMVQKKANVPPAKDRHPEIAGYRVKRRIGVGGYGAVYLAERETDGKKVAIKVMLSRVAVDESARRKFVQEVDLLKLLRHENVVTLYESGSAAGAFYFVMEHCPGGNLTDYADAYGGKLASATVLPIMLQALKGLAYAHGKGVVHRDLKPANILLAGTPDRPVAKIADLGLAKNFDKAGFSGMTVTGAFAGTPYFMPKEQLVNFKYVKPVTDVWGIAATFYNVMTGRMPREFPDGCDPVEVILRGEIIPIGNRDASIPRDFGTVLDRALQSNPKDRYQDAAEMLKALENVRL